MSAVKLRDLVSVEDYLAGDVREVHEGLDAVISLDEIGTELPLGEIYDGAEFAPQTPEAPRLRAGERP